MCYVDFSDFLSCANSSADLQETPAGGVVLQMEQRLPAHQVVLWHLNERSKEPDMDSSEHLTAGDDCQEKARYPVPVLHFLQTLEVNLFKKSQHCN